MTGTPTATAARVAVLSSAADAITAARGYAASIADGAITRDRAGKVPYPELAALDASGLLGITVPAAYGGPELSPEAWHSRKSLQVTRPTEAPMIAVRQRQPANPQLCTYRTTRRAHPFRPSEHYLPIWQRRHV